MLGVVGQRVELVLVEVLQDGFEAREGGVVERLELRHRAREPLGVALTLELEAPVGERLEVGEFGGEGGHVPILQSDGSLTTSRDTRLVDVRSVQVRIATGCRGACCRW